MDDIDFEAISLEFTVRGWTWNTTEQVAFTPTADDVKKMVSTMQDKIEADAPDGVNYQINVGRLILQRVEGVYDLYLYAGSLGG